jgi:hypothetical protein
VEGLAELAELVAPPLEEPEIKDHPNAAMAGLEWTFVGCTSGEDDGKFKTPTGDLASAITNLNQHREDVHGQPAGAAGGASKVQLSNIPGPEISGGCSQEDFKFFTKKWGQYLRSLNETDQTKLKDQLTNCPNDSLRNALYKALGDRINSINVDDLMKEIEELTVV